MHRSEIPIPISTEYPMNQSHVHTRIEGAVFHVTIDRQDKLNALNRAVLEELSRVFATARDNSEIRVVVMTGAGSRAFVAGADIAEIRQLDREGGERMARQGYDLALSIQNLGKPVIAAVNGYALGGGCELALACSIRIASSNALFGLPEIKLGLMPGFGGTQRLARLIGRGLALEMALTGEPVDALKAKELGLISLVVEPEELEGTVNKLADKLARSAPHAMRGVLNAINLGSDLPLEDGLQMEIDLFADLFDTQDMREGTAAFLEKRKPEFIGR
jgi:enoyl-CoA hydratase